MPSPTNRVAAAAGTAVVTTDEPLRVEVVREDGFHQADLDVHQAMEVAIVTTGTMERQIGAISYRVGPGDVALGAAWEPHRWRMVSPGAEAVAVLFLPALIEDDLLGTAPWLRLFTAPPGDRAGMNSPRTRETALGVARRIVVERAGRSPGWRHAIWLEVLRLLLELSREWRPSRPASEPPSAEAGSVRRIAPAVALVHASPAQVVGVAQAAAACGLSTSHFAALFRSTMGLSFATFCRRVRLGAVAHLLLTTSLPLDQIAAETGFVDASHLHRTFVKHYGLTPSVYRSRQR